MNALKFLAVIAVVALLGLAIGWFGTGTVVVGPPTAATPGQPAGGGAVPAAPLAAGSSTAQGKAPAQPQQTNAALPAGVAASDQLLSAATNTPAPPNLITNWEERLDEVLAKEDDSLQDKAKELLGIFMNIPQEGQVEVAQHLANLTEDENYMSLGSYLTNTALSEEVLDVLLSDLLNRPNTMKVPMLVGVARDPKNPKAAEARDILEMFLEEDYGTDWDVWQKKAEEWLKDNPD